MNCLPGGGGWLMLRGATVAHRQGGQDDSRYGTKEPVMPERTRDVVARAESVAR